MNEVTPAVSRDGSNEPLDRMSRVLFGSDEPILRDEST